MVCCLRIEDRERADVLSVDFTASLGSIGVMNNLGFPGQHKLSTRGADTRDCNKVLTADPLWIGARSTETVKNSDKLSKRFLVM